MSKIDSDTFILNRHDFDTTFTATYDNNTPTSGTNIITPATGNRLQVVGIQVDTTATTGTIRFRFQTSADTLSKFYASSSSSSQFISVMTKVGRSGEPLNMISTFGAGTEFTVTVSYKEYAI